MPIHDWTRRGSWVFDHFHLAWIDQIARSLNRGVLSDDYYALVEREGEIDRGPDRRVHLLILDLFPPGPRDPRGIHAAIWEEYTGLEETLPADRTLTLASYESAEPVRAFVEPVAVGDALPDMPLFLRPRAHVPVPLEATYGAAFEAVPARWRRVLAGEGS